MTQTRPGLAAVLFDVDGTLVGSERLWDVALRELAIEYGWFQGHKAQVNAVVIDPDDQTDLERLGIEMREPQKA